MEDALTPLRVFESLGITWPFGQVWDYVVLCAAFFLPYVSSTCLIVLLSTVSLFMVIVSKLMSTMGQASSEPQTPLDLFSLCSSVSGTQL